MIQPGEIQSIAGKEGVRDTQIEKNYVISWLTYGIANNPFLKENLVFKGGTVLKKVYFPDYRFSEDLDFTFTGKDFDIEDHVFAFQEKSKYKGYDPNELTKVMEQKEKIFAKHWKDHLSNQMTEIPDFNDVWRELGKHWRKFQKFIE
jgi:uncharacterized protein